MSIRDGAAVAHQPSTLDPGMGDLFAPGDIHQMEAGSKQGCSSHSSSRTAHRSAALPGSSDPILASRPSARAPPSVAADQDGMGIQRLGVLAGALWPARRHGAFHETGRGDCWTRHRRCPGRNSAARLRCRHRRDPAAEFQVRGRAMRDMAAFVRQQFDFAQRRGARHAPRSVAVREGPGGANARSGARRAAKALLDLVSGFVDMQVDGDFQLGGKGGDALEGLVGHGVGCVRRKAEVQQRRRAGRSRTASPFAR
jgi:hypothetical protein